MPPLTGPAAAGRPQDRISARAREAIDQGGHFLNHKPSHGEGIRQSQDENGPDAPYAITEDFMNKLFNEYNIDYIIHGDGPRLLLDGADAYAFPKNGWPI